MLVIIKNYTGEFRFEEVHDIRDAVLPDKKHHIFLFNAERQRIADLVSDEDVLISVEFGG